jgi:hypothetical protein
VLRILAVRARRSISLRQFAASRSSPASLRIPKF